MRAATLIVFAAVAVATTVQCAEEPWFQSALIYQIYPRSFKDSDGDGIGDLNGITQKLPYLKDTGVDAIWLSPIYKSPMYDFGYDITDYRDIAEEYGTMDDFDALMVVAKQLGIRVVLDYVPNHTGNESEWFVKSAAREPGYENFYIWADGKPDPQNPGKTIVPSNWVSQFRKTAWEFNKVRQQYYLHQFAIAQPDLNYREPAVQEEMKNVLRFWLDKGVSGFRMDAVNFLYEVDGTIAGYPDEPASGTPGTVPDDYEYLSHIYTRDQLETYDVIYDWRDVLDEYISKTGESKVMLTEAYTDQTAMLRYYSNGVKDGSIPFNFVYLGAASRTATARNFKEVIDSWMTYMPLGKIANWVNGNHDQSRIASKVGTDRIDAMNMMAVLLPGITLTYQGEEIGMTDGYVRWEDTVDPQACNTDDPLNYYSKSRDPNRTPYHWDASPNAGFSNCTTGTWLPLADNYKTVNLAAQMKAPNSHYKFYKDVVAIKKSPAVRQGDLDTKAISDSILIITRMLPGSPSVIGIVNFAAEDQVVDLSSVRLLSYQMQVAAAGVDCAIEKGKNVSKSSISVSAHCAVVLQSVAYCC